MNEGSLRRAENLLAGVRDILQGETRDASALEALVLLPLIEDVSRLDQKMRELSNAVEVGPSTVREENDLLPGASR